VSGQDQDFLPSGTRMSSGAAPGQIRGPRSVTASHLGASYILIYPSRGKGARLRRAERAPLRERSRLPGRSLRRHGPRSGPGSPIIQRLGCPASRPFRRDSRVFARQCVGSSSLFPHCRYVHVCDVSRRLSRAGSPGCAGRRSVVAWRRCATSVPRRRRIVLPRSSRGGHGGGWKAVPKLFWVNAPCRRAVGYVAFQSAAR
jgi:hypothetical protein